MTNTKLIKNNVKNCAVAKIDYFQPFQDELKTITPKNLHKLKESFIKNGITAPLILWKDKILDGHQRKIAIESLIYDGYSVPEIPYVEIKAETEQKAKEILLTLASQYGDISKDGLEQFVKNAGLNPAELATFIAMPRLEDLAVQALTPEIQTLAPTIEPKATKGDIYALGGHRLICGDSTSREDIEKLMDGKKADMVFTDPPYNVDYKGGGIKSERQGILNDKMSGNNFYAFLVAACKNMLDYCEGGYTFVCPARRSIR